MTRSVYSWLLVAAVAWPAVALAGPLPPASERFAQPTGEEIPDFQRHVTTLLGRQGCNGRACHGSFQGQGDFRLSLFGYDFEADHAALLAGKDEPRTNLESPEESLILAKPTDALIHGGGERLKLGSWQYNLLLRWVKAGAPKANPDAATFERLEVTPSEILFTEAGQSKPLTVIAHWSDGTSEIVTPLSRFQSNDESMATVNEDGVVTAVGPGDTHIVVFYENGVHPISVLMPLSPLAGSKYPTIPATTEVDRLVLGKLRQLGVLPSQQATDEEFLRRVRLDLTGTLPTEKEVLTFLADQSQDKRARKIDELLGTPEYAAWWTTKFNDWTGNNLSNQSERSFQREYSDQWYDWVYKRIRENRPYDEIVEGLVLATSREEGESYEDYVKSCSAYIKGEAEFAERDTMPHFWARQSLRPSKEKALSFAYAFLGVRLQCAECHKHPFDQWTQQDFEQFTAFFDPVRYGANPQARDEIAAMEAELGVGDLKGNEKRRKLEQLLKDGKLVPMQELFVNGNVARRSRGPQASRASGQRVITPRLLGGDEVVLTEFPDPRVAVMDWMRDEHNPYFAKAMVNRVWANYFGVGIIEPADDLNLANPPSNGPLLDWLAEGFVKSGYDLHWLHRTICNSDTYQRSWRTNETNQFDRRNFSHALLRRIPAEVVSDALQMVTASDTAREEFRADLSKRQTGRPSSYVGRFARGNDVYLLTVFGKPERLTNCDCERSDEPTLLQTVFLRNDDQMHSLLQRRDGWLAEVTGRSDASPRGNDGPLAALEMQRDRLKDRIAQLKAAGKGDQAAPFRERLALVNERIERFAGQVENTPPARREDNSPKAERSADQLIEQAYLRVLARKPDREEAKTAEQYLTQAGDTATGIQDLFWALLNTKEFLINH